MGRKGYPKNIESQLPNKIIGTLFAIMVIVIFVAMSYLILNTANQAAPVNTTSSYLVGFSNAITGPSNYENFALNPQKPLAYLITNFGSMSTVNLTTNSIVNTISVAGDTLYSIVVNPSGTTAYIGGGGSHVDVVDLATNSVVNSIGPGTPAIPNGLMFNPISNNILYIADQAGALDVANTITNSVTTVNGLSGCPDEFNTAVGINPSGTLAYVLGPNAISSGSLPGVACVVNLNTNALTNIIITGVYPTSIAFNPSGSLAYVTNFDSGSVSVINVSTSTVVNTITTGTNAEPYGIAIIPSGLSALVTSAYNGAISIITLSNNKIVGIVGTGYYSWNIEINQQGTMAYISTGGTTFVSLYLNKVIQQLSTGQFLNFLPSITPYIGIIIVLAGFAMVIFAIKSFTDNKNGSGGSISGR